MNEELRVALEDIPLACIEDQEGLIEQLRTHYNHSIVVKDSNELFPAELGTYNCYAFAFNLVGLEGYIKIANTYPRNVFANSEFVNYLLDQCELTEIDNDLNHEDGMIIYLNNENISTHAGKIRNGKVISKWGTGLLYEHDIYDVPLSYGSVYKIYQSLSAENALELFYDYSETKGWSFECQ